MQRLVVQPQQIRDRALVLTAEQQHYLQRVLRLGAGDRFVAMDGRGGGWETQLVRGEDGALQGWLGASLVLDSELPMAVTLLVAIPKGSGFDEIVRQTTELGASRIVPVLSDRTLVKPSPNKLQRWRRIATEAAEQSERQVVPDIWEPRSFSAAIAEQTANPRSQTSKAAAHAERFQPLACLCVARGNAIALPQLLQGSPPPHLILATGPEGGWTPAEIERAKTARFQPVSLGKRVLRAVTAPMAALAIAGSLCESARDG